MCWYVQVHGCICFAKMLSLCYRIIELSACWYLPLLRSFFCQKVYLMVKSKRNAKKMYLGVVGLATKSIWPGEFLGFSFAKRHIWCYNYFLKMQKFWISLLPKGVFGVVDLATKSNSPSGRGPWGSETARTQKLKSTFIIFKSLFPRWP